MPNEPQTISIAPAPETFNRALRAFDITNIVVSERDGQARVTAPDIATAIGELVNALAIAHIKLIAAESNVATLNRIRQAVASTAGLQAGDYAALEDILEDVERVISSLEGISREP